MLASDLLSGREIGYSGAGAPARPVVTEDQIMSLLQILVSQPVPLREDDDGVLRVGGREYAWKPSSTPITRAVPRKRSVSSTHPSS
jgi:hypothetical protein